MCGVCSAAIFAGSAIAQTPTIEPVQGDISFSQGQGFQRVDGRVQANVGDSVMVGPDGAANVVYSDGCRVNVQPGSVASIAPLSPCASGSFADSSSLDPGLLLMGAAFLGGTGMFVYGITQAKNSAPVKIITLPVSP
jgi:hypothetical protein